MSVKLTAEEASTLSKKLEYRFKKSGNEIVTKLESGKDVELSDEEKALVSSKLEYRFKHSKSALLEKLK